DGIDSVNRWQAIVPDQHNDWINQRDDNFNDFMVLGAKKSDVKLKLFEVFSLGATTNRDAWCYNLSKRDIATNMGRMIEFFNSEIIRFKQDYPSLSRQDRASKVEKFVDNDPKKICWSRGLRQELSKGKFLCFDKGSIIASLYRPFSKQWLYFNRNLNEYLYQIPRIFPNAASENRIICVSGVGARSGFSTLIVDAIPNLHALDTGQCFPLYLYEDPEEEPTEKTQNADWIDEPVKPESKRRDAITDEGLAHFQAAYPNEEISKEDLFYYVYGLLHSPDYRERYADNLTKELPRIPAVKTAADFWAFSKAGRDLAHWHLNYETVEPYPVTLETTGKTLTAADYRVEKMRYGKALTPALSQGERGKAGKDLTTLHYNDKITLRGIPLEAYEYVVNGKPALDWVVERQGVKVDKDSGIVNDANDWAIETMNNPRYPLELFQRVITVSLETLKIVKALPALAI
ncbi:MAG: type ISP restriction/modification enzyme, partial [Candidatus Methylumidiphilus sp.]